MKKLIFSIFLFFAIQITFAQKPAVVIIDSIVAPSGTHVIGDIVQFDFDLHNMGPYATTNPITINYKLPAGFAFVPTGSSSIFSQSGSDITGIQTQVMSVGDKRRYTLKFQVLGSACPANTAGSDPTTCSGVGFLTISGGSELSPGYLRWREWTTWGTGGRENYANERISLYFPVGQDTPISSTTANPSNKGTAPAANYDYLYYNKSTTLASGVISNNGSGTRRTWEWYGIIVPDESTDYTFCGSQIDDGWAAWISKDWDPQKPSSMNPFQMQLIGENYTYQAGTNVSTPNFHLTCGRPYFFRIVISSRNSGQDGPPYGYTNVALRKVSQNSCDEQWGKMIAESINIPLMISINCPPTVRNDAVTTDESTTYNGNVFIDNSSGADSDINSDTYAVSQVNGKPVNVGAQIALDKGLLIVNANGTFTFNPNGKYNYINVGQTAVLTFTYNATDARGAMSDPATVQITVTGVNNPPVTFNKSLTTNEDTPVSINITSTDYDIDGTLDLTTVDLDPFTSGRQTSYTVAGQGVFSVNAVGVITFTPAANFNGVVPPIKYNVKDNSGATSNVSTISVTIISVNDVPVAVVDNVSTNEDTPLNGNLATNDIPSGDGGNVWVKASNPSHGTVVVNADGTFTYTPTANYNGLDNFTYKITDVDGDVSTASVNITVISVNDVPVAVVDNVSTNEDTPLNGNLATNDIPSGDGGNVWAKASNPSHGTVVVNADGTFTYTPSANYNGLDNFTYKITDVDGDVSTASVNITVISVNDVPVAVVDNVSTNEDTPLNGNLTANDIPSGDGGNVWSKASNPSHGTVVVNADGTFTYTPSANYSGLDNFTYKITDVDGDVSTASVNITVISVNDVPVAVVDNVSTNEDTPLNGNLATNDIPSGDGGNVWAKASNPSHGTVVVNADGTFTYTPSANYNGLDNFTYKITDVDGDVSTASVNITVISVNDVPVAVVDNVSTNEDTPLNGNLTANDIPSGDGGNVWSKASNPSHGTVVVNADGTFTYTPSANYSGLDNFTYEITDIDGDISITTVTVLISNVNSYPLAVVDNVSTNEDTPLNGNLAANDIPSGDGGNVWSKVSDPLHGTVVVNADGTFTYTPTANYSGLDNFAYKITDANGDISTASVNITVTKVNHAPVATNDTKITNEDTPIRISVLSNDTDVDGDVLTITSTTNPTNGTVAVNADGTIIYSPTLNFNGSDTFNYTISDGNGGSSTATVTVTVLHVNHVPVATNDTKITNEDTPVTISVLSNDADVDGDVLTITSTTNPTNGTVVVNADGTITYSPTLNFNGSDTFNYTIKDGNGGSSTATVTVTVLSVNDPPVAVNDTKTTNEDTPVTIFVLSNDTDVDGDVLTITSTTNPTNGTVVVNADGTITYFPTLNFNGSDTFNYTIKDGNGGSSTATVTVAVLSVNDLPVAVNDTKTTNEVTPVTISVLSNDTDVDGDVLTITGTTNPTNGTVFVNANGTITYSPTLNFNGSDTFDYTVSDGNGGLSTATVTVTVLHVNHAPVAVNDTKTTNEDTPTIISVLSNDTDMDGDVLTITGTTNPINGTVVVNADGTITYFPNPSFYGTDSFDYTIKDGNGGSSTATVSLTVNQVNHPPTAVNDVASTDEDSLVKIAVLNNDNDKDGDALTIVGTTTPSHGTVVVNADGTITYSPTPLFNGIDSFNYTISDGNGGTSTATVNLTIFSINHPPVATNDIRSIDENTQISIPVLNNDFDIDNDILTVVKMTKPAHGDVTVNANGLILYIPDAHFVGTDTFDYTISDGNGGFSVATVTIHVDRVNNPPVAKDDYRTTKVNTLAVILVLGNDTDIDGDPLNITNATSPINGSLVINPDGTITYTPNNGYVGSDTFYYTISDGYATSTARVFINIDYNTQPLPKFWKKASVPVLNSNGTFSWKYTITVNNNTNQSIDSVQVIDNLDDVFKEKGCTYEVTEISAYGSLWANGLFNGSNRIETLISDSSYVKSSSINSIVIEVKVNSHNYVGPVHNQAIFSGHFSDTKYQITRLLSDDVSFPGTKDSTVTYIPEVDIFIPEGFSPNGDGINDYFVIKHSDLLKINIEIVNRWGNTVYKNTDYKNDWDGKGIGNFLGKDLPVGTYFCSYKVLNSVTGELVNRGVKSIYLNR